MKDDEISVDGDTEEGIVFAQGELEKKGLYYVPAELWKPKEGVNIQELNGGLYLFHFFHRVDLYRVMVMNPWTFDYQTLVLESMEGHSHPSMIQIHILETGFHLEKVAKDIGNKISDFLIADLDYFSNPDMKFLYIWIKHDVCKSIWKGIRLKKEGGEWLWVRFSYDVIGHFDRFCSKLVEFPPGQAVRSFSVETRASFRLHKTILESKWLRTTAEKYGNSGKNINRYGKSKIGESYNPLFKTSNLASGEDSGTNVGSQRIFENPTNMETQDTNHKNMEEDMAAMDDDLVVGDSKRKWVGSDQLKTGGLRFC
uniref:DUF4283 domain-containing protein n=1 Tax=Manihot esculenta TaxID=3983 RepID=A0A2C9VMW8_MANES